MINIAIIMMQKNEGAMLDAWIKYHASLFGAGNIYIFDNGSNDHKTIQILRKYDQCGVNVDYSFSTRDDFRAKGRIILNKIYDLQGLEKYDFYFPMDADEFLGVGVHGSFSANVEDVRSELSRYVGTNMVLRIGSAFDNNPIQEDKYLISLDQRKCFFYKGTAKHLDVGFHEALTDNGSEYIKTDISYIHFHHKNYQSKIVRTKEKLTGRVKSFSKEDLLAHKSSKGMGFHLVDDLLVSESDYYKRYISDIKLSYHPIISRYLKSIDAYEQIVSMMDFDYLAAGERAKGCDGSDMVPTNSKSISRPHPSFPPEVADFVRDAYSKATVILEYGSGGSTIWAGSRDGAVVFSTESDKNWVEMMRRWFQQELPLGTVHLQHVDIGPTKEWGYPKDSSRLRYYIDYAMSVWERSDLLHPDVVLIDGRFRVACFLATLMNIRRQTTVLFDDYGDRQHYHVVEYFLRPVRSVGRMAVFEAMPRTLHASEWRKFGAYFFLPE